MVYAKSTQSQRNSGLSGVKSKSRAIQAATADPSFPPWFCRLGPLPGDHEGEVQPRRVLDSPLPAGHFHGGHCLQRGPGWSSWVSPGECSGHLPAVQVRPSVPLLRGRPARGGRCCCRRSRGSSCSGRDEHGGPRQPPVRRDAAEQQHCREHSPPRSLAPPLRLRLPLVCGPGASGLLTLRASAERPLPLSLPTSHLGGGRVSLRRLTQRCQNTLQATPIPGWFPRFLVIY